MKNLKKITFLLAIATMQTAIQASQEKSLIKKIVSPKNIIKYGVPTVAAAGTGLFAIYKKGPEFLNLFSKDEMVKKFGYNPRFFGLSQNNLTPADNMAVITAHGFGDQGNSYRPRLYQDGNGEYQHYSSYNTGNSFTVGFDFHDAAMVKLEDKEQPSFGDICKAFGGVRAINLGGVHDAKPLLYAIQKCATNGYPVTLMGHSRGGAAIIKALEMLSVNPKKYKSTLNNLGITDSNRKNILKSIKKIFLANPMLSIQSALKTMNKNALAVLNFDIKEDKEIKEKTKDCWKLTKPLWKIWYKQFGSAALDSSELASEVGLGFGTKFESLGTQPIDTLKKLAKNNPELSLHITQAKNDDVVGTAHYDELKKLCEKRNKTKSNQKWFAPRVNKHHCDLDMTNKMLKRYLKGGSWKNKKNKEKE